MKKRLLSFVLAIAASLGLTFGLTACNETPSDPPGMSQENPEQSGSEDDPEQSGSEDDPEQSGSEDDPEQGEESLPPTEGLEYTLSDDKSSYFVSGIGTATDTDIVILSTYEGLPVTTIGDGAFSTCTSLMGVTIPDSVTTIGDSAFEGCDSLTSVTMGDSVTTIGDGAFSTCTSLTSVTIPDSVTSIGENAFSGCSSLESVTMPAIAIDYIPKINLKTVVITSGESIGDNAFRGCSTLENVTISNGVASIGRGAFRDCTSLTSITIPFIGAAINGAENNHFGYIFGAVSGFANCVRVPLSLKTVVVTGGESIDDYAFYDCDSLTSITILDSATNVGEYAFYDCDSLTSITIPDKVTSIGEYAFSDCDSLTSITIPDKVTSIGEYAFYDCSSLKSVTIGKGVTSIGRSAFVVGILGNSIIEIYNKSALAITAGEDDYSGLVWKAKNVYTQEGDSWFTDTPDGFRFFYDGNEKKGYLVGYSGSETDITLPDGFIAYDGTLVTEYEIYEYAFYHCSNVTSVTIPNSVTGIGHRAFMNSTSLVRVTILGGVTEIDYRAFYNCDSLARVTILGGVTSIGESAFANCTSLASITLPDSLTSIHIDAFTGCDNIAEIYNKSALNISAGSSDNGGIAAHAKRIYTQEDGSWITDTADGYHFFYNSNASKGYLISYSGSETDITLPDSFIAYNGTLVTEYEISSCAFYDSDKLTSVTIPNSVTTIGDSAFSSCDSLANVIIGDSVTTIGDSAFSGCDSLANVTIGDGVTTIGDSAFSSCDSLASVTIPDSVITIGVGTFDYCSSLGRITIGKQVKSIGIGGLPTVMEIYNKSMFYVTNSAHNVYTQYSGRSWFTDTADGYHFYYDVDAQEGWLMSYSGSKTDITLPDSFTAYNGMLVTEYEISAYAFSHRSHIISVTIPNSVTRIGNNAFQYCTSLESVTILGGETSMSIGKSAFVGCSALEFVVIPGNVTKIDDFAFQACTSLVNITLPDGLTSIGNSALSWCPSLTSITIPGSVTSMGQGAFNNCTSLESVTILDGVTSIGYDAFSSCSSLKSVTIPDSVTVIHSGAFYGCSSLDTVYYKGTAEAWSGISIGSANSSDTYLTSATRYYYSAKMPVASGNYWHYAADGVTPVIWE